MQYIKLTDPSLLDERVLDIAVVHGLVLRNQAFKVTFIFTCSTGFVEKL